MQCAAPGGPRSASSAYPCLFKLDEAQEAETHFAWPPCRGGGDSTKLCFGQSREDCSEMNGNRGRDNAATRL